MLVQHLQLRRHSLKYFPLLTNSFWNAFDIHRGSQQWKVRRFNHFNPPEGALWRGLPACCHWKWWAHICYPWSPSQLLWTSPVTHLTKSSWTLYFESQRVASSKYQTLNSDWTPRASSSTDRANRLSPIRYPQNRICFQIFIYGMIYPKINSYKINLTFHCTST